MIKPKILGLVDSENLYYSPKKQWGTPAKVDYYKLYKLITHGGHRDSVVIAYLVTDPVINQNRFVERLKQIGYTTKMKVIYSKQGNFQNSNWDPEIIQDGLEMIDQVDKLVMVSGDGGFSEMIKHYTAKDKETSVICFKDNCSFALQCADTIQYLDQRILMSRPNYHPNLLSECRFPMR